ncbi:hypothetical protein [Microbacterium sp. NPDC055665]
MTVQRNPRRVWAWIGGIAAAAVVSSVLTGVLLVATQPADDTPVTPAATSTSRPVDPEASASPSDAGVVASGCTAVPISVRSVLALRASRDLTPKGAAEFAGAVVQLVGLTPMDADLGRFLQQATTGKGTEQVGVVVERGGMDSVAGSASLWGGSYIVEEHTAAQTVVLLVFTPLENGVAETNDQGQTHQRVVDVVLQPSGDGWVLAELRGATPKQEAAIFGEDAIPFRGAC